MIKPNKNIISFILCIFLFSMSSCSNEIEKELTPSQPKGEPAVVYASIGKNTDNRTRATYNSYDRWSIASFINGDVVGMYALTGKQNPANENEFNQKVENGKMLFEGSMGNYYRFGNSEIILDPQSVNSKFSMMYYPYYEDMPPTYPPTKTIKGKPLRELDGGIEKCIDFMETYISYSSNGYSSYGSSYLTLTNGVLMPKFYHYCSELVIQRGEGFKNARDRRIWVVMQKPLTDIRIVQSSSTTSSFTYQFQYNPEDNEDLEVQLVEDVSKTIINNKYRVWQAWQGTDYNGIESYYAIIPSSATSYNTSGTLTENLNPVSYILIQDDNGNWQNVGDFYLYNYNGPTKLGLYGNRYVLTIELLDLNAVVRPVLIEDWNDEISATDNRKVGIYYYEDFVKWASLYNLYTESHSEDLVEQLKSYGDAVKNEATGEYRWTFYINNDIELINESELLISKLEDTLMGSSEYKNYTITNLTGTLIGEITETGKLQSLSFDDVYIISIGNDLNLDDTTGALTTMLNGGTIENCTINNGIIVSDKPAGIVAGTVTSGTVRKCRFTGQVVGSTTNTTYPGIFGTDATGAINMENNHITGLYFENYN